MMKTRHLPYIYAILAVIAVCVAQRLDVYP
jgi:hypothetical protein